MSYYIDLKSISLDQYKSKLKSDDLIPSRMILKERIDERFNYLKNIGITNVHELQQMLKNKDKKAELSETDCFSEDYLTILLREINSIHPKPNKIGDFLEISPDAVSKLEEAGIKDTLKLYVEIKTPDKRKKLSMATGIDDGEILKLTKLTDLSRVKWVGATFARVLFNTGFDTVEKLSEANYEDLYNKIIQLNKEKNLYKGNIGLNDMKLCVNAAKEVPLEIIF